MARYVWPTLHEYEGEWKNGLSNGKGKKKWPTGSTHEGEFWVMYCLKPCTVIDPLVDLCKGSFVNGMREGFGTCVVASGRVTILPCFVGVDNRQQCSWFAWVCSSNGGNQRDEEGIAGMAKFPRRHGVKSSFSGPHAATHQSRARQYRKAGRIQGGYATTPPRRLQDNG